ncbi:hypothetical protein EK904_005522, partial [Melospiza melodia maxima]
MEWPGMHMTLRLVGVFPLEGTATDPSTETNVFVITVYMDPQRNKHPPIQSTFMCLILPEEAEHRLILSVLQGGTAELSDKVVKTTLISLPCPSLELSRSLQQMPGLQQVAGDLAPSRCQLQGCQQDVDGKASGHMKRFVLGFTADASCWFQPNTWRRLHWCQRGRHRGARRGSLSSAMPTLGRASSLALSLGSGSSLTTKLPDKKLASSLLIIDNFNFKTFESLRTICRVRGHLGQGSSASTCLVRGEVGGSDILAEVLEEIKSNSVRVLSIKSFSAFETRRLEIKQKDIQAFVAVIVVVVVFGSLNELVIVNIPEGKNKKASSARVPCVVLLHWGWWQPPSHPGDLATGGMGRIGPAEQRPQDPKSLDAARPLSVTVAGLPKPQGHAWLGIAPAWPWPPRWHRRPGLCSQTPVLSLRIATSLILSEGRKDLKVKERNFPPAGPNICLSLSVHCGGKEQFAQTDTVQEPNREVLPCHHHSDNILSHSSLAFCHEPDRSDSNQIRKQKTLRQAENQITLGGFQKALALIAEESIIYLLKQSSCSWHRVAPDEMLIVARLKFVRAT